jgi:hypothetical protein
MTTVRVVYNFMTETVFLEFEGSVCAVEPHGRETLRAVIPVCDDRAAFERTRMVLSLPRVSQRVCIWESAARIRFSTDNTWCPEAAPVAGVSEAGGARGITVGATGAFWLKKVNI